MEKGTGMTEEEYIHKDKIREKIKALKYITRSDLGMFKQYEVIDLQIELLEELLNGQ